MKETQMDDKTKASLTNLDTWKRGLFMVVFAIISGLAKLLVTVVAVFQFVTVLIKGETNEAMLPFGQNLSTYIYQITTFLTFNTDVMPFPFMDFPNETSKRQSKEDLNEKSSTTEDVTNEDEKVVELDVEPKDEEVAANKNSKDDPLIV